MNIQLPDILSEIEEDIVDLVFAITAHGTNPDGSKVFRAEAVHDGDRLGLEVVLGPDWEAGTIGKHIPSYSGIVMYRTIGTESDRLIRLIDHLYGTNLFPSSMKQVVTFEGITLHGNPDQMQDDVLNIKLFFIPDDEEEEYAELYTNIDISARKLQIREKDEDYRAPLVRALGITTAEHLNQADSEEGE